MYKVIIFRLKGYNGFAIANCTETKQPKGSESIFAPTVNTDINFWIDPNLYLTIFPFTMNPIGQTSINATNKN